VKTKVNPESFFVTSTPSQEYGPLLASHYPWGYNDDVASVSVGIELQQGGGGGPLLEHGNRIIETPAVDIPEDLSMDLDGGLRMLGKRRRSSSDDKSDTKRPAVEIQEDLSIAMDESLNMLGKRRRSSSDDNSETIKKQSRN
jgi:hypothetical protein